MHSSPIYKDIILVGGGHSHALLLRMWAMNPIPGVRITLVSNTVLSPYSGMLPGVIAGHYTLDDNHIDLVKLCRFAGARFIHAEVTGFDVKQQRIQLRDRPELSFDYASINTGAAPDQSVPGVAEFATPIKPIAQFTQRWQALRQAFKASKGEKHIAVVGSGAGGIEVLLAMQHALSKDVELKAELHFHLVVRGKELLKGYSRSVKNSVKHRLAQCGVKVHYGFDVAELQADKLMSKAGQSLAIDNVFWCTSAKAPVWPKASGFTTDPYGFISVTPYLKSLDNPHIFAAGDIAHMPHAPRPKAGVYAVRQAPVLLHNLRNATLKKPLKPYKPQDDFLSLVALGNKTAAGSRKPLSFSGAWAWSWKDRIDREFMGKFKQLPPMTASSKMQDDTVPNALIDDFANSPQQFKMRCGGCGAKVGASVLSRVLKDLQPVEQAGLVQSMGDDAAAFQVPENKLLVQSVDQLRNFIDDPYVFGRLSALHALSDLFAMNASPHSAQAMVNMPYSTETVVERELAQLMAGAVEELNRHGCALIGGHTSEGQELSLGFVVNGLSNQENLLNKAGAQQGDVLIITQALGTGTLFAADMRYQADGRWIEAAIQDMLHSNRDAANIFSQHGANACTDVTGFGLAGHLAEILKSSDRCAELKLDKLPIMAGVQECLERGIRSSLYPSNRKAESVIFDADKPTEAGSAELHKNYPSLFDPQTCGGLLACVPEDQAASSVSALHAAGYKDTVIIGNVLIDTPNEFGECIYLS